MEGKARKMMRMPAGLHIVRKLRAGKPILWYVYAWRGGPCIHKAEGTRPAITAALTDLAAAARVELRTADDGTVRSLITGFRASAEWDRLAPSTRVDYTTWLDRIADEFGDATLRMFSSRAMRGEVLEWRDRWIAQPRSADAAVRIFARLLSWGVDRGRLTTNILTGVAQLYEADRSDVIWEARHFDTIRPHVTPELWDVIELASLTGLRRGDLLKLPREAIGEHAIIWRTGKSRGRNRIVIPVLPGVREVLARIEARHAEVMTKRRPERRRPLPATALASSYWRPWTPDGFSSGFNKAKQKSGLDVNFHDLRGTFATRCMIAGATDQEIADILGWATKDVAAIRVRYVDQARVVVALGKRIAGVSAT